MSPFDRLVVALDNAGYVLTISTLFDVDEKRFASSDSKGVSLGFCEPCGSAYRHIDGCIAADHKGCFNKWSQCPYVDYLPETDEDAKKIVENLKWLGTNDGFKWSNTFSYINDPKLPRVRE